MSQFTGGTFGNYSRLWLIITGVILLGVGAVMAVTLGGIPYAGGAMLGTGGLMALVGIILIVVGLIVGNNAKKSDQILQTGIPGTASITGLTQTGVYLNENPQINMNLLITLPGEVPYAASHKEFVPLMLLGRLSTGAPLPCASTRWTAPRSSSTGVGPVSQQQARPRLRRLPDIRRQLNRTRA